MPTAEATGTQTATLTTEHTLTTITDNKTLVLVVDTANLVNGEILDLKIYTKCLNGGTERLAYHATYANVQSEPIKYSMPVPADISWKATLTQNGGTGRDFPWAALSL